MSDELRQYIISEELKGLNINRDSNIKIPKDISSLILSYTKEPFCKISFSSLYLIDELGKFELEIDNVNVTFCPYRVKYKNDSLIIKRDEGRDSRYLIFRILNGYFWIFQQQHGCFHSLFKISKKLKLRKMKSV